MNELTCKRCGHQWQSRIEKPKCCPGCKQYRYDRPRDLNPAPVTKPSGSGHVDHKEEK